MTAALSFVPGETVAPSGVRVRHVDVHLDGTSAQRLHDALEHGLSTAFDLDQRAGDVLRVSWTDTRLLTTHEVTALIPDIVRALATRGLISLRNADKTLIDL